MAGPVNRAGHRRSAGPFLLLFVAVAAVSGAAQIQLSKPKTEKPLPNPSILPAPRDEVLTTTRQMLETREIPIDKEDCNSTTGECIVISKPVVFIKGITTRSQLEHYSSVPSASLRNWSRGRYVLRIVINPATQKTSEVGVYARFEGLTDGVMGSEWVPLASKGELEDKLLRCIQDRLITGECRDEIR